MVEKTKALDVEKKREKQSPRSEKAIVLAKPKKGGKESAKRNVKELPAQRTVNKQRERSEKKKTKKQTNVAEKLKQTNHKRRQCL